MATCTPFFSLFIFFPCETVRLMRWKQSPLNGQLVGVRERNSRKSNETIGR